MMLSPAVRSDRFPCPYHGRYPLQFSSSLPHSNHDCVTMMVAAPRLIRQVAAVSNPKFAEIEALLWRISNSKRRRKSMIPVRFWLRTRPDEVAAKAKDKV